MCNKIVQPGRRQMIYTYNTANVHCMMDTYGYKLTQRICNTFPLQQRMHERSSVLRYTCIPSHIYPYNNKREGTVANVPKGNVAHRPTLSMLLT